MARMFVTGGSGFVGRNLIETLVSRGDEVLALVRSDEAARKVEALGARAVRGELHEPSTFESALSGVAVVFHAAAKVDEWGDPKEFHRVNVLGTEGVIEAAKRARVATLVHVSSEAVLLGGEKLRRVDESFPMPEKPVGLYPRTKAEAERRVRAANGAELRTVVVRPRLIWGKGDTALLPKIIDAIRKKRFSWIDDGAYLTSTCHVRNVVEGILLAAEKGRGGEVYFLTDGEPIELSTFLRAVLATQGVEPGKDSVPFGFAHAVALVTDGVWSFFGAKNPPPLTHATVHMIGEEVTVSDAKARRELGYASHVTREEGLREMAVA